MHLGKHKSKHNDISPHANRITIIKKYEIANANRNAEQENPCAPLESKLV